MVWERSSVWLERLPVTQEVAGSSPVVPAITLIKKGVLRALFFINKEGIIVIWKRRLQNGSMMV